MKEDVYYKKITTYNELDHILPMIEEFHSKTEYNKRYAFSGYLNWLTTAFPYLGIWVGYKKDPTDNKHIPFGYLIASMQFTNMTKELVINEAYTEYNDTDITQKVFKEVLTWGSINDCKYVICNTEDLRIANIFVKRYGFSLTRYSFSKKI